jgi:CheY-like chemotaxis protein
MQHHDSGPYRRVLVVEDDPVCRRYTSEALRQAGSTVKQTDCIRRALCLALEWRPGLILTDLNLPDGSGEELVRRLRAAWPAKRPLPLLVAMTAAGSARRDGAVNSHFHRVLRKPFEASELAMVFGGVREHPPACEHPAGAPGANDKLRRLARQELLRHLPRIAARLESGRLESAAALAHRLAASAAVCGAAELGRHLQTFSDACTTEPLPAELAETFTAARRLARDFAEGVTTGWGSG